MREACPHTAGRVPYNAEYASERVVCRTRREVLIIFRASVSVSTSRTRHSPLSSLDRGLASAPSGDDTPRSTLSRHPLEHLYSLAQTTTHTLEFSLGYPLLPAAEPLASTCAISTRHTNATNALLTLDLVRCSLSPEGPSGCSHHATHTRGSTHSHTHVRFGTRSIERKATSGPQIAHTTRPTPTTHAFCMQWGGREESVNRISSLQARGRLQGGVAPAWESSSRATRKAVDERRRRPSEQPAESLPMLGRRGLAPPGRMLMGW